MFELVVFDLDGTLVDSREDLAAATNQVLAHFGGAPLPLEAVTRMVGDGARMLVERALRDAGLAVPVDDALEVFHRAYATVLADTTRPYAGIQDLLDGLRGQAALAVLTNKPLAPTERLLDEFGWADTFNGVIGGDGPWPRKPDPAGLEALMSQAGVKPAQTVMVGDSVADVGVAERAGTAMCFVAWGFGNARGDVHLRGHEFVAHAPQDVLRYFRGR